MSSGRAVADKLEERSVEAGRHLTTEHGSGYFFFVVESGTADVLADEIPEIKGAVDQALDARISHPE